MSEKSQIEQQVAALEQMTESLSQIRNLIGPQLSALAALCSATLATLRMLEPVLRSNGAPAPAASPLQFGPDGMAMRPAAAPQPAAPGPVVEKVFGKPDGTSPRPRED